MFERINHKPHFGNLIWHMVCSTPQARKVGQRTLKQRLAWPRMRTRHAATQEHKR